MGAGSSTLRHLGSLSVDGIKIDAADVLPGLVQRRDRQVGSGVRSTECLAHHPAPLRWRYALATTPLQEVLGEHQDSVVRGR